MDEREYPRPLSEFDMHEVYRIIHNESIPGFVLLGKERRYIEEYREALKLQMEQENENQTVAAEVEAVVQEEERPTKRRSSRKKKQAEPIEEGSEEIIES